MAETAKEAKVSTQALLQALFMHINSPIKCRSVTTGGWKKWGQWNVEDTQKNTNLSGVLVSTVNFQASIKPQKIKIINNITFIPIG